MRKEVIKKLNDGFIIIHALTLLTALAYFADWRESKIIFNVCVLPFFWGFGLSPYYWLRKQSSYQLISTPLFMIASLCFFWFIYYDAMFVHIDPQSAIVIFIAPI